MREHVAVSVDAVLERPMTQLYALAREARTRLCDKRLPDADGEKLCEEAPGNCGEKPAQTGRTLEECVATLRAQL
jgi:hypothetical protein